MSAAERRETLLLALATAESFEPYGQVILPADDGEPYGAADAQLDLTNGIPRFYAMRLAHRGRSFSRITRHRRVTQCLGAMHGIAWMLGVAAPSESADAPDIATLRAFLVPGDRFVKLHRGTWHAGPYFGVAVADFYNLELADTNIVDHQTCDLAALFGVEFVFGGALASDAFSASQQ